MTAASVDDRGRLYLPKDLRKQHGDRYRIVSLHNGIKLVPVSEDPVEGLAQVLTPITARSVEQLRTDIEEHALEDVVDDLR